MRNKSQTCELVVYGLDIRFQWIALILSLMLNMSRWFMVWKFRLDYESEDRLNQVDDMHCDLFTGGILRLLCSSSSEYSELKLSRTFIITYIHLVNTDLLLFPSACRGAYRAELVQSPVIFCIRRVCSVAILPIWRNFSRSRSKPKDQ